MNRTYKIWIGWYKCWQSSFTTVYFPSGNVDLDGRINVQCLQCLCSFLRCQRTQPLFSFEICVYDFLFPPRVGISRNNRHAIMSLALYADCWNNEKRSYLMLVSSSTSSELHPWVQPEKASMSISYLRWSTKKGPFCLSILMTFLPSSSIWGVNLKALKFTRQRSLWISKGWPLFARRASVLFKWTTLYFWIRGRTCMHETGMRYHSTCHQITELIKKKRTNKSDDLIVIIWDIRPTNRGHCMNHSQLYSALDPWR